MLTARRPSHTLDMRSVSIPFWLRGNYDAMTFFGSIVTHSDKEADRYNALQPRYPSTLDPPLGSAASLCEERSTLNPQPSTLNTPPSTLTWYHPVKYHETIHLRQAQSVHNSWLCFYWKYFIFWFKARRANRILPNAGYELNPFEMEAYANMYNPHYLDRYPDGRATGWQAYAQMSLAQRFYARRKYARR